MGMGGRVGWVGDGGGVVCVVFVVDEGFGDYVVDWVWFGEGDEGMGYFVY